MMTGKRAELSKEDIVPYLSKRMNLDDAAKELGVSTSTLKRRIKDHGIRWTRANKSLKHSTESSTPESESAQLNLTEVSVGAPDEHGQECCLDGGYEHLVLSPTPLKCNGSSNSSSLVTVNEEPIPSTYYAVKVTFRDDIVRINFPCLFTFDQLKEEVARKLNLELNSFKIKYADKENDLVLIADDTDLQVALNEFGGNTVRIIVCDVLC